MRAARVSRVAYESVATPSRIPYICKSCRQNDGQQSVSVAQQRRNASSNTPFTEKIRRKIWGTDNPPGLKDPYGGPSFLEKRRMAREAREGLELKAQEQQLEPEESYEVQEMTEDAELQNASPEESYQRAETWDGLQHIGHRGHWRDQRPRRIDIFIPYLNPKGRRAESRTELLMCLHQAIVEYYFSQGTDWEMIRSTVTSQARSSDWETMRLAFPGPAFSNASGLSPSFYEAVFRGRIVMNELGEIVSVAIESEEDRLLIRHGLGLLTKKEAQSELLARVEASIDGENELFHETLYKLDTNKRMSASDIANYMNELEAKARLKNGHSQVAESTTAVAETSVTYDYAEPAEDFLNSSLVGADNAKFKILTRFSKLSGHRVPDPILGSSKNLREMIDQLAEAINPKPKTLADALMQKQELAGIPNLKIMTRRETPVDKEKEVGRWKLIEAELISRGLPVLGGHKQV